MNESVGEHDYSKICDFFTPFLNQSTRNSKSFLLAVKKKVLLERACMIAHTVLKHCPISVGISTIDGQSDLRILLQIKLIAEQYVHESTCHVPYLRSTYKHWKS